MQKQKNTKFKKWPLVVGAVAAVAATAFLPSASTWAWGPERTTYTMENPADEVVFNSITNNNIVGDERNFVRVREAGTNNYFTDEVKVVPGKEYEVYIYYHNNAKSSMNANGSGIATGLRASTKYSASFNSKSKGKVNATITWDAKKPGQLTQVWDEAYFVTDSAADVLLRYIPNSATIHNDGFATNGGILPDTLFGNGVLLGVNKLDGLMPACSEYSGHITYKVRAEQVGAKVVKSVSKDGKNFFEKVSALPGDTLTYKVEFTNTGSTVLHNVTFHDKLPAGVTLVPGTSYYTDNKGQSVKLTDLIGQNGYTFGNYNEGIKITLTYQVKVDTNIVANKDCGTYKYKNMIYVDFTEGEITDDSTFEIEKTGCKDPDPEPEPECVPGEDPECTDPDPKPECVPGKDPECTDPDPEPTPDPDPECVPGVDPECSDLPKTGPAEIALAVTAIIAVVVGSAYWYHSQKALEEAQAAAGASHKKHPHKK